MGILDWITQSAKKLKDVEDIIGKNTQDVHEVYQRNVVLEREIAQRTEELHLANQTLLTLEQVWDMMNSSRPLSSVLETIVSSLYDEFGYIYSFIAQKQFADDGSICYNLKTYLENDFANELIALNDSGIFNFNLYPPKDGIIENSIKNKEIGYYINLKQFIDENIKNVDQEKVIEIIEKNKVNTIIIFPIIVQDQFKGFLSVFSPRKELKEDELSFLGLFSRQIELAITIANLFETVKKQAVTDHLTNLFNRRFFEDALQREATRSIRTKQPFCLIGLDLDHLKRINDTYGHSMGDKAISAIANVISNTARSVDIAARYGGEEFFIILPGIDTRGGMIAAERIRNSIENFEVEGLNEGITASLGVSCFIEQTTNIDDLFEMCDKAMYFSKENGRNQVTLANDSIEGTWQNVAVETFINIFAQNRIPISDKLAKELVFDLQKKEDVSASSTQEILYTIVDTISKTYFPLHQDGSTKGKVQLATLIAKKLNLDAQEVDKLKIAMLLYDIGNTKMPKKILKKAAPLSNSEKEEIKKHPTIATNEILKSIDTIADIIPIIEQHHENWDGSGYPNQIKGSEIHIIAQIIMIVDSYFAMISYRPYRRAYSVEEAIQEIKSESDKKYSKELVSAFSRAIEELKKL